MSANVYVWIHEYKDTEGITRYTIAASPVKPSDVPGTELKTYPIQEVEFLAVNQETKTIYDIRNDASYIESLKEKLIEELQDQTYKYIVKYMPLWKQNSWSEYMRCYEKAQMTNESLTQAEQAIITEMTDNLQQSPSEVYTRCQNALQWIVNCKIAHKQLEQRILACTTYDELSKINIQTDVEYPDPDF